jgi:hypothetical protein
MSFDFNATGIDPDSKGTAKLLPKRWFDFEIVEFHSKAGDVYPKDGKTKNGDPMVNILCEVINDGEFDGERVFHTVTFLKAGTPGAGMSIHFLKSIGQPWEGQFEVNSEAWVGAHFKGYVITDEYKGKTKNKLGEIKPIVETEPRNPDIVKAEKEDSVPF